MIPVIDAEITDTTGDFDTPSGQSILMGLSRRFAHVQQHRNVLLPDDMPLSETGGF